MALIPNVMRHVKIEQVGSDAVSAKNMRCGQTAVCPHAQISKHTGSNISVLPFELMVAPAEQIASMDAEPELTTEEVLLRDLHEMYFGTTLNARQLCTIMHSLSALGHSLATPFALKHGSPSGHYQRKLEKAYGFKKLDSHLMLVDVPLRHPRTGDRVAGTILCQPLHEALARELKEHPSLADTWASTIGGENCVDGWIEAYEKHPVVLRALENGYPRAKVYGITLYMDAAAFDKTRGENLLIMTGRFVFSHRRHLIWAIRKSNLCNCGCGG